VEGFERIDDALDLNVPKTGKSDPRSPGSGLLGGSRAPNQYAQEVREIALKRLWLKLMSVRNGRTVLLKITDEGGHGMLELGNSEERTE
jgi:hypothetical protein